jgi:hypothetical protein
LLGIFYQRTVFNIHGLQIAQYNFLPYLYIQKVKFHQSPANRPGASNMGVLQPMYKFKGSLNGIPVGRKRQ